MSNFFYIFFINQTKAKVDKYSYLLLVPALAYG